jgi:hypothetical protein
MIQLLESMMSWNAQEVKCHESSRVETKRPV